MNVRQIIEDRILDSRLHTESHIPVTMRDVIRKKNVVGFDVVELCPSQTNKSPDFIAAKIIYQLLSYKFQSPPTPLQRG